MKNNKNTISSAIEMFTKHIDNLSDEEIEKRLRKYDNSKYSGMSISELDTLFPMTYPGNILTNFGPDDIFVFGSNTQGRHGKGSALLAVQKFGAKYGQSEGLQGRSFAIITKDLTKYNHPSRTPIQIIDQIKKMYKVATELTDKNFKVVYTSEGTNLNSYSSVELAGMFVAAGPIPLNVFFSESFFKLM